MIKQDYVDFGVGGGSNAVVERLMGEVKTPDRSLSYTGTVPRIMARGGFTIKCMIRDGESRAEVLEKFGGSILVIPWDTQTDMIRMKLEVNLSKKVQKIREGLPITPENVGEIDSALITLRVMTSQIYRIYDPLGLLSPITIKYKLLLQELSLAKLGWDDVLPEELDRKSRDVLKEMVLATTITFERALMRGDADTPDLMLVGFSDGRDPASAATLYLRSKRSEIGTNKETHEARL